MIELVVDSRCDGCGACLEACPTRVFDLTDGRVTIARQSDCQTCFLCELYCQADALYVAPDAERARPITLAEVLAGGTLGEYRRLSGWHEWEAEHPNLFWRQGEIFARARR